LPPPWARTLSDQRFAPGNRTRAAISACSAQSPMPGYQQMGPRLRACKRLRTSRRKPLPRATICGNAS
jgi:hypothetical protein